MVGVPLLVVGLRTLAARGSVRGLLLWLGMINGTLFTTTRTDLLGAALNVFFPLYIVLLVLSVATLVADAGTNRRRPSGCKLSTDDAGADYR